MGTNKNSNLNKVRYKICLNCKENKPKTSIFFYRRKNSPDGFDSWCKECKRRWDKKYHILKTYKINNEEFKQLLDIQNNSCPICRKSLDLKKLNMTHIDHCHKSGKIRGLLCHYCNNILNFSKENPFILIKAIKYLKKHNCKNNFQE